MNLWPFKKKGTEKEGELTKEEWLMECMPLIPVAMVEDRVAEYQQALSALSVQTTQAEHAYMGLPRNVTEYRFVLDASGVSDPAKQAEFKKAFAMFSGSLKYLPEPVLVSEGWNLDDIVAPFLANQRDQIGALLLVRNSLGGQLWRNYHPELPDLDLLTLHYFNIRTDNLSQYIKPLIERYVQEETAQKAIDEAVNNNQLIATGDWLEDYFNLFKQGAFYMSISGGDAIAEIAADDRLNPDGQHFRLSSFFLNGDWEDSSQDLTQVFEYRQRLPIYSDITTALLEPQSLAGHPLITLLTGKPIETARVDLIDQDLYKTKNTNQVEVNPYPDPNVLVLQKAPTPQQLADANSNGIDLTGHGISYFDVHNPDGNTIELQDATGLLNLSQTQIGPNDWQTLVSLSTTSQLPVPAHIDFRTFTTEWVVIKQLELFQFEFKMLPVSFWFLHPLRPQDFNLPSILSALNRVYGKQANTYIYAATSVGSDPHSQILNVNGYDNQNQVIQSSADFWNSLHQAIVTTQTTAHDLNIAFTWMLKTSQTIGDEVIELVSHGITKPATNPNLKPLIVVDIVSSDPNMVGSVIGHELGHWISHALLSGNDSYEFDHGQLDEIILGAPGFAFNLMNRTRSRECIHLSKRQAELINQSADSIS